MSAAVMERDEELRLKVNYIDGFEEAWNNSHRAATSRTGISGSLWQQREAERLAFELRMRTVDSGDGPVGVEDNLPGIVLDQSRPRTLDVHAVSNPARRPVRVEDILPLVPLDDRVPVRRYDSAVVDVHGDERHFTGAVEEHSEGAHHVVDDVHRESLGSADLGIHEDLVLGERAVVGWRRRCGSRSPHGGRDHNCAEASGPQEPGTLPLRSLDISHHPPLRATPRRAGRTLVVYPAVEGCQRGRATSGSQRPWLMSQRQSRQYRGVRPGSTCDCRAAS